MPEEEPRFYTVEDPENGFWFILDRAQPELHASFLGRTAACMWTRKLNAEPVNIYSLRWNTRES
jgi:hypothetical protein